MPPFIIGESFDLIGKNVIKPFKVVDHAPFTTTVFHLAAPIFHAGHIFFRIDIISAQFGHIQSDNIIVRQLKRKITFISFGEFFLKIRKNQNVLFPGFGFI